MVLYLIDKGPDMQLFSVYNYHSFFKPKPKHMLLVLKRTISTTYALIGFELLLLYGDLTLDSASIIPSYRPAHEILVLIG